MSINAIGSVSLYEYYYKINNEKKPEKETPLEKEMKKYGLKPTDSEALNIAMLNKAKEVEKSQNNQTAQEIPNSQRPWADLMYQLNLSFNDDPKDDIRDIKDELDLLVRGVDDDELEREIDDLKSYAENLYISFSQNYSGSINTTTLTDQLNNLSVLNKASFL